MQAGACEQGQARTALKKLQRRVLAALTELGPSTVQEISQAVPALQSKIRYGVAKAYEGEFSLGSRLVLGMCALGLLVRTRPRGSPLAWRSHLYEMVCSSPWVMMSGCCWPTKPTAGEFLGERVPRSKHAYTVHTQLEMTGRRYDRQDHSMAARM